MNATSYISGFCGGSKLHDRCRGTFNGVACSCRCHTPPPLGEPLPVAKLVTCPRCRHDFAVPLPAAEGASRG